MDRRNCNAFARISLKGPNRFPEEFPDKARLFATCGVLLGEHYHKYKKELIL